MAKISARGDEEVDRFQLRGWTYILTRFGRILRKEKGGRPWYLVRSGVTPSQWEEQKTRALASGREEAKTS